MVAFSCSLGHIIHRAHRVPKCVEMDWIKKRPESPKIQNLRKRCKSTAWKDNMMSASGTRFLSISPNLAGTRMDHAMVKCI